MGCKYNETYFESLNANSAYILGFILADGTISCPNYKDSNYKGLCYRIKCGINQKDVEILDFIKQEIAPDRKLYYTIDTTKNNYTRHSVELTLTNKILVKSIMAYGIYPNKTGKETFPNILEEFYPDFIRGFFDGDGTVGAYYRKTNTRIRFVPSASFVSGSYNLLCQIKQKMNNIGGKISNKNIRDNCCYYQFSSKQDLIGLYNYMYYNNDVFCLKRKKQIFNMIMENI